MDALLVSMKPSFALSSVLALGLAVFAVPAFAQSTQANPDVLPAAGGNGPTNDQQSTAPASTTIDNSGSSSGTKSTSNLNGATFSDKPTRSSGAPRGSYRATGPTVNMPGFEPTTDGGSRFFVQLSQSVPVEERKANGSVTYVLKGASPRVWNNTNPLVTVLFNTPVSRARLVPSGKDLLFVLDLRAAASPTWKMNDGGTNGATLAIDFAKGDFVNTSGEVTSDATAVDGAPVQNGNGQQQQQNGNRTTGTAPRTRGGRASTGQPRVRANTTRPANVRP